MIMESTSLILTISFCVVLVMVELPLVKGTVTWKEIPEDVCTSLNETITLTCAFDGLDPQLLPEWHHFTDSTTFVLVASGLDVISGYSNCEITGNQSKGEYHLTINSVEVKDVGVWRCKVSRGIDPPYHEAEVALSHCSTSTVLATTLDDSMGSDVTMTTANLTQNNKTEPVVKAHSSRTYGDVILPLTINFVFILYVYI